jgi:hypothetical protein
VEEVRTNSLRVSHETNEPDVALASIGEELNRIGRRLAGFDGETPVPIRARSMRCQRIGAQLRAPLTGDGSPPSPDASRHEPPRERSEQRAAVPRDRLCQRSSAAPPC